MSTETPDNSPSVVPEKPTRRAVAYQSLAAIVEDAEFLASHPHVTVGNWSFGRVLQHLADALNRSFDGFDYRAPFYIRLVAGTILKKKFLTQEMPSGYQLPRVQEAKLPSQDTPVDQSLQNLQEAVRRFEREEPRAKHPAFGKLSPEEWIQFHLRHAELHMSFVKPA